MPRHVHVRVAVGNGAEEWSTDAGDFREPVVLEDGLVQVAPTLFVASSAFIAAEYHDEHGHEGS